MQTILDQLTPLQREVLAAHYVDRRSYAEIGQRLDRSKQAVHRIAKRGRAHLERCGIDLACLGGRTAPATRVA